MSIVRRSDQQVPRRPFRSDITIIASFRDEYHSSSLSFTCSCRDVLFVSRVQDEQLVSEVFPDDKHKSWYYDISGKQLRLRSETVRDCKQIIFKMFRGWGTNSSVLNMLRGQTSTRATSRCEEGESSRPSPQMQSLWGGDSENPYKCHHTLSLASPPLIIIISPSICTSSLSFRSS